MSFKPESDDKFGMGMDGSCKDSMPMGRDGRLAISVVKDGRLGGLVKLILALLPVELILADVALT